MGVEAIRVDLIAAIKGSPRSEADVRALATLRAVQDDVCLAGDQALVFDLLRAHYARKEPP